MTDSDPFKTIPESQSLESQELKGQGLVCGEREWGRLAGY
jgi:hypothetical protein